MGRKHKMMYVPEGMQTATADQTRQHVQRYIEKGCVLDDGFGTHLMMLSNWQAVRMGLNLQRADFEDAVMTGVFNCLKYGLKDIAKKELKHIHNYLCIACKCGILRWLERHNKHYTREVVTDPIDIQAMYDIQLDMGADVSEEDD